jgi:nucleoside-diphosphate-sugar epimerase
MRVLVSGATGVIGTRVIPLLIAQGYSVTALVRNPSSRAALEQAGAACAQASLFDTEALKRTAARHDAVVNLATHMPAATWKMLFRSAWRENDRLRTTGVANLVDAALAAGIPTLIQESFAPAYPDSGDQWIDESTALAPAAYNRTVLEAERSIARFTSRGGRGVVLRFAAFYGPDAMQLRSYIESLRRGWAALPGDRGAYFSSVSHEDAAAAVAAALDAPAGPYNVGDDEPVTREIFFGSLAGALGLKPPQFLPAWTTRLFGSVGELMARSLRLSNRKLRNATGWVPRYPSVREGLPAALLQMRDVDSARIHSS